MVRRLTKAAVTWWLLTAKAGNHIRHFSDERITPPHPTVATAALWVLPRQPTPSPRHHDAWTLDTPLATIVGLYSNIDGSLDEKDKGPQEAWLTEQLEKASYQRFSRKIGSREIPYIVAGAGGYANTPKEMQKMQTHNGRQFEVPYQTTHPDLRHEIRPN